MQMAATATRKDTQSIDIMKSCDKNHCCSLNAKIQAVKVGKSISSCCLH